MRRANLVGLCVFKEVIRLIFFFQAEDGIRYWSVTGVQTCALPILEHMGRAIYEGIYDPQSPLASADGIRQDRSEERRVGKECKAGWCAYSLLDYSCYPRMSTGYVGACSRNSQTLNGASESTKPPWW